MKFSIPTNTLANEKYFNFYLKNNYIINSIIHLENEVFISAELTELQKADIIYYYNNIIELDWLEFYKVQKFDKINAKTEELIKLGYVYNGLNFSLSEKAQTNILALYSTQNSGVLLYPISWNTINDVEVFQILNSTVINEIYYTALSTKKNHLDSGTILKNIVRSANTVDEIDLIIDNR